MEQVERKRTPVPFAAACQAIESALLTYYQRSTPEAVGKILAVLRLEHGVQSVGGVASLWNVWNNNPGNLKPAGDSVDFIVLPGATEFDAEGKPVANPSKKFAAFPSFGLGMLRWVWQVKRRWPRAIAAAFDASQPAEAVAAALLDLGVGDDGKEGHWGRYATAGANPTARANYLGAVRKMGPESIAIAQGLTSPKVEGAP